MEFATIGSALSSRRKVLNIDQARAAAIIGMSRTTFSSYERDLQRPSAEVLPSLAQFLEISIEDILTLYGGTCIEALRPSLERYLATHGADTKDLPRERETESATPVASAPDPVASDAPTTPAPAANTSGEPAVSAFDRVLPDEPVAPLVASKDASVSIFANELSDTIPRVTEVSSNSSDSDHRDVKATKGKGDKKKKGKKGKRSKS
jgi:transcriptional regulator with XRE-family HTH domain